MTTDVHELTIPDIRDDERFSYCVGTPWHEIDPVRFSENPNDVRVYSNGSQVQHGTMADARKYCEHATKRTGYPTRVYVLVPMP